jgi:type VI protein secretion system component VasF
LTSKIFQKNKQVVDAKGDIPYWVLANQLNVHENTVRNWMKREMTQEIREKVLNAIAEVKQELAKAQ